MATLALKGHATRGKEVINLLEMLGANRLGYKDTFVGFYYYIECGAICSSDEYPTYATIFTLEEFLEKYPYKVGDRVSYRADKLLETQVITNMRWDSNYDCVLYYLDDYNVIKVEEILYKIGSPEDNIPTIQDKSTVETIKEHIGTFKPSEGTLVQIDFTKELRIADEVEVILGDYEFVLKDGKTYFVKKNKYPKTYEECCEVLNLGEDGNLYTKGHQASLIQDFHKLFICRAAYWEIAGEEMGLDKPWEPDWSNNGGYRYCIRNQSNKIVLSNEWLGENYILSFPTAEMRDEFYNNFKELIEECKELL